MNVISVFIDVGNVFNVSDVSKTKIRSPGSKTPT